MESSNLKTPPFTTINMVLDIITKFLEADQNKLDETVKELREKYGILNDQRYFNFLNLGNILLFIMHQYLMIMLNILIQYEMK